MEGGPPRFRGVAFCALSCALEVNVAVGFKDVTDERAKSLTELVSVLEVGRGTGRRH